MQVTGTIKPGGGGAGAADPPLCRWFSSGTYNGGHGRCKTDVSWLLAAAGIKPSVFDDALANYIIRFHLNSACYRATQVRVHTFAATGLSRCCLRRARIAQCICPNQSCACVRHVTPTSP